MKVPEIKYLLGNDASDSITVKDNDDGGTLPQITISGTTPVTEGEDVVFDLTAVRAPTGDNTVNVRVRITETADFLVDPAKISPRIVTVPVGSYRWKIDL